MNDEQEIKMKEAEVLTPAELSDAVKVLIADNKNSNIVREELKNSQHQNEQDIKLILTDLDNPHPRFDRTSTRKLAVAGYEQAQGFISTENLEEHKIIKDIKESIEKYNGKRTGEISQLRRRIETIPSPDNMQDLLNENFTFKEIAKEVDELLQSRHLAHKDRESLQRQIKNINAQRHIADHPTRTELDNIGNTLFGYFDLHDSLIQFLKGVFSSMKMDAVAKCIEDYKVSQMKEVEKDEEPTGTSSESE